MRLLLAEIPCWGADFVSPWPRMRKAREREGLAGNWRYGRYFSSSENWCRDIRYIVSGDKFAFDKMKDSWVVKCENWRLCTDSSDLIMMYSKSTSWIIPEEFLCFQATWNRIFQSDSTLRTANRSMWILNISRNTLHNIKQSQLSGLKYFYIFGTMPRILGQFFYR